MIERPGLVIALSLALLVIGVALLVVLGLRWRWERQSETFRRGGGVYRSAHAAGRRIRGGADAPARRARR